MFRDTLASLLRELPGAQSATVMGFDGIAIETQDAAGASGQELPAAIEVAAVASQLRRAAEGLSMGAVHEVALETDRSVTLVRPLTSEYLLALTMAKDGLVGKARFKMRVLAPRLTAELG